MSEGTPSISLTGDPITDAQALAESAVAKPSTDLTEIVEENGETKMRLKFHPGQYRAWISARRFIAVIAGSQAGKAICIDTLIPTPNGLVPMRDIHAGMEVYASNGRTCKVLRESPIFEDRQCFRVTFDDGSSVVTDAEHLWEVSNVKQRKNFDRHAKSKRMSWGKHALQVRKLKTKSVLTTLQISKNVMFDEDKRNYSVKMSLPVEYPEQDLPIPPYTLGAWIGDGFSATPQIISADPQILQEIKNDGIPHCDGKTSKRPNKAQVYLLGRNEGQQQDRDKNPFMGLLRDNNLVKNKHIPEIYFRASVKQRLALVQGLMDTDGYVGRKCQFVSTLQHVAEGMLRLLLSLGVKAKIRSKIPTCRGKPGKRAYIVDFSTTLPVFRLERKLARIKKRIRKDALRRFIISVEPVPSVPVKCIAVDSLDSLYLCTEACIPTHNTVLGPVWLWREIKTKGRGDYLVVAPTFTLLELKALPAFVRFFDKQMGLGRYVATPIRRFVFSEEGDCKMFGSHDPMNLTTIYFAYAEDPESLESMTVKGAWLDECGQRKFKLGSWQAIQRRLAINEGRALMTTTPYDFGWLKKEVFDKFEAGDKNYDVINFKSTDNPAFSQAEYDRAKASMPPWQFDLFYNGIFRRPAGLVYDCFTEKANICERFDVPWSWDRIVGLDFGGTNTVAFFIAEEPFTAKLYVYRTYKAGGRTALEHCYYIQENEPDFRIVVGGSRGEGQWRQEFRAGGVIVVKGVSTEVAGLTVRKPKEADVKLGINRVYGAFKRGELVIFDDLEDVLKEIEGYQWALDANHEPTGEIEGKGHFHHMDSCRYVVGTVRGPHYEQDLTVTSETKEARDSKNLIDDAAARKKMAEDYLADKDRRERARQEEADRLDKLAQSDINDPRWMFR